MSLSRAPSAPYGTNESREAALGVVCVLSGIEIDLHRIIAAETRGAIVFAVFPGGCFQHPLHGKICQTIDADVFCNFLHIAVKLIGDKLIATREIHAVM